MDISTVGGESRSRDFSGKHMVQGRVMERMGDEVMSSMKIVDKVIDIKVGCSDATLLHSSFQSGIVSIFNGIVCPSRQHLCDGTPFVAQGGMCFEDCAILMRGPVLLLEVWVELIHPSFACLLATSTGEMGGD